jgi:peptide/nickel transport system ATP-binding protein
LWKRGRAPRCCRRHAATTRARCWPARPTEPAGEPLLAARSPAKRFGTQHVLRGLDLQLGRGEHVALLGPSGCGKSTLGNLLVGLLRPDAGTVWREPRLPHLAFQKLSQDPSTAFAPRQKLGRGLADLRARHGIAESVLDNLLRRLRLPPGLLARRPDQVSGGGLQRLALARVLALDPAFLFADEPTSRLDPIIQQEVMALLLDVADDRKLALLRVTREPALAARSATRVVELAPAAQ